MKSKKGEFDIIKSLPVIAIVLTMFILILGAGLLATGELNTVIESERDTASTVDEITLLNATAVALTYDEVTVVTSVANTNNGTITSGNYTSDLTAGTITLTNNAYNNTAFNVTYSFTIDNVAYTATNDSIVALGALGSTWANPIITMAAIGIMIGVIFSAFAFVKLRR